MTLITSLLTLSQIYPLNKYSIQNSPKSDVIKENKMSEKFITSNNKTLKTTDKKTFRVVSNDGDILTLEIGNQFSLKAGDSASVTVKKIEKFDNIRQGTGTNALTKMSAKESNGFKIDEITGNATIKNGNFILSIPKYEQLAGLKTSTHQLLDAITLAFTNSGAKSPTVILPLEEYMSRRGLKDRKEAKTQAKADMDILKRASFSWEEKRGKTTQSYAFVNLADSGEIKRNGSIVFTFGATFYNALLGYNVMPYPAQLQTINNKKNPNSYYLLRKIAEHKNMNVGKKNENIISVKTLLDVAPFIPSYEEVMKTDRHFDRRIIVPFERDMDALEDTLTWHYCHSLNQPLTEKELDTMSYEMFEKLLVHTIWKDYPDQTARLERKQEHLAQTKKKRQTTSKKKRNKED